MRAVYMVAGLAFVGVGGVGVVVPGLPTTVFFVMAAWCFSRSSERLERWVLNLPGVGPMVADYRNGLGMPRRAKVMAISCLTIAVTLSVAFGLSTLPPRALVLAAGAVGIWWILKRVPTRETVLAQRASA